MHTFQELPKSRYKLYFNVSLSLCVHTSLCGYVQLKTRSMIQLSIILVYKILKHNHILHSENVFVNS